MRFEFERFFLVRVAAVSLALLAPEALASEEPGRGGHETFAYLGENGPDNWDEMLPGWAACGAGMAQSPVDLATAAPSLGEAPALEIHYGGHLAEASILNNGHTVLVNAGGADNHLLVNGERHDLLQFHWHCPSEHVAGGGWDMEMHFVNRDAQGHLAVLGVLIDRGEGANATLAEIFERLPEAGDDPESLGLEFAPGDFLPENLSHYHYAGSLTTPPCSEDVQWFVLRDPVNLPCESVAAFAEAIHYNARPAQPLNGRSVELVTLP